MSIIEHQENIDLSIGAEEDILNLAPVPVEYSGVVKRSTPEENLPGKERVKQKPLPKWLHRPRSPPCLSRR
ncbi:hypothetical protein Aduo_018377 [Ancylostoma duodenale]